MKTIAGLLLVTFALRAVERKPPPCELGAVKRVYVEQLGGGQSSDQMRDMIISAMQKSALFTITENQDTADAIIRGSADDKTFTEDHNITESIGVHAGTGDGSSSNNYSSGTSSKKSVSAGVTNNETSRIEERRHEASAALRMVNTDGDVIWSTTQESGGAKFRGAMADVADKITRQLTVDVRKARSAPAHAETPSTTPQNDRTMRQ